MENDYFDFLKAFDDISAEDLQEFHFKFDEITLATYSKTDPEWLKMTLSEIEKIADETEKAIDSGHLTSSSTSSWTTASSFTSTRRPRRSISMPEFVVPFPTTTTTTTTRTRKSISSQKNVPVSRMYEHEVYRTPMTSSASNDMKIITPKVNINRPIAIMRKPFEGEHAVSVRGSPLMIDRVLNDKKANVNIPLSDGRVMSILPIEGLRKSQVPVLDDVTRKELFVLRKNIDMALNKK